MWTRRIPQHAVTLVVHHVTQTAKMRLVIPADELLSRTARERSGAVTDQSKPGAIRAERDMAHRFAYQPIAQPMVLGQLRVETGTFVAINRAHQQAGQVGVTHPETSSSTNARRASTHAYYLVRTPTSATLWWPWANTREPLSLSLHGANRPSHEGVVPRYDAAIALCREAGFGDILLRGDTDFSLTAEFDRWDADGVRFVFGYDAKANLIERAEGVDDGLYHDLVARAEREVATGPRIRPRNVKDDIVRRRGYKVLRPKSEEVVEFSYRPGKCAKDYRVVALRKNISVERGDEVLFDEYRYFFYITNDWELSADEVVGEARQRCNQENLIGQLKGGVRALHAPVNTLNANWALCPVTHRFHYAADGIMCG